jgi:hypothetical protein
MAPKRTGKRLGGVRAAPEPAEKPARKRLGGVRVAGVARTLGGVREAPPLPACWRCGGGPIRLDGLAHRPDCVYLDAMRIVQSHYQEAKAIRDARRVAAQPRIREEFSDFPAPLDDEGDLPF